MRKILLAAAIITCLAFTQTEKYYITFIKGSVIVERTGKALKVGDALQSSDKLIFKDMEAKISCISPGKGRFNISSQQAKVSAGGELLAVLKSIMVPSASNYQLSTRSLMFEGYDPRMYFQSSETGDRILLIKDETLPVVSLYKADDNNFFFIQYNLNGKPITRKVAQNENGIIFTDKLFDGVTQTLMSQKVMLCYQTDQQGGGPRSSILAEFIPVLASRDEIREQIQLITEVSGSMDKKKLNNEIIAHLFDNYGKIGSEEISRLLR